MADATISDITVVLKEDCAEQPKTNEAVAMLKAAGMEVRSVDEDQSVVEGTIDAWKVKALEKLACVEYVRVIFTYDVEYPPGDPRDINGVGGIE
jgi:hypothetical protein